MRGLMASFVASPIPVIIAIEAVRECHRTFLRGPQEKAHDL